ncbi:MAG: phosphatidylserine decarboxylase, partial [bacterium]|nr:phosphatidylserine decarboxylase [bacterium]
PQLALLILSILHIIFFPSFFSLLFLSLLVIALLLTINFFRDPERKRTYRPDTVYAPADGVITSIGKADEKEFLKKKCWRIKIFMNVFNVHRNRIPLSGEVDLIQYRKGKLQAAFKEVEASNEQFIIAVRTKYGKMVFKQVAGLIARRIVCNLKKGDRVRSGAVFGMIKFGSAVIIYLPFSFKITARVSDNVKAGLSELARKTGL